jgi:hypothetical protein
VQGISVSVLWGTEVCRETAREAPELGLTRRKGPEAGRAEGNVGLVSADEACTLSAAWVGGCALGRSHLTALPVLVQ